MLAVHSSVEAKTVPELVALAKRKPGGLSYASQGVGTAGHLLGELFARSTGVPLLHVPYRGAAPAVIDLVAGRVDMMFVGVLPSKQHLDAGTLRALAVTSKTRMPEVPDAPTMAEAGHPDVDSEFVWFGLAAPAKTPEPVIRSLHDLFAKAAASPDVRDKLAGAGHQRRRQHARGTGRAHQGRHREVRADHQGVRRGEIAESQDVIASGAKQSGKRSASRVVFASLDRFVAALPA